MTTVKIAVALVSFFALLAIGLACGITGRWNVFYGLMLFCIWVELAEMNFVRVLKHSSGTDGESGIVDPWMACAELLGIGFCKNCGRRIESKHLLCDECTFDLSRDFAVWVCPKCGRRTESANSPCDDCVVPPLQPKT